jgi:uncharacterized FlaG/YvyC family protein
MSDSMVGQVSTPPPAPLPGPLPGSAKPAPQEAATAPAPPPVSTGKAADAQAVPGMPQQISTEDLAKMLQKVNLTFDLFEIEADASIDPDSHELKVIVRNTRTGEVIRRIPPHDFKAQFDSFRNGVGLLIDRFL